jgi:1-aminocyclopropane-1-carboxylate deaminase/D-cysteine desulfhydrase-like pyridoxal-dependent ACC family enzyme
LLYLASSVPETIVLVYKDIPVHEKLGIKQVSLFVRVYGDLSSQVSGNKPFKLKHFLSAANTDQTLISFGGAWSNHLLALSAVAKSQRLNSVGVIRGERPANLSPYLLAMQKNGMYLHFVSREDYKRKEDPAFLEILTNTFQNSFIIPEGGAGELGIEGASEMVEKIENYDVIFLPGATGTTLAGVAKKLFKSSTSVGCVQVLKGENILKHELKRTSDLCLDDFEHVQVYQQFHFGGYAKKTQELLDFQDKWNRETNIPIDLVYGAKALYGLKKLIESGHYKKGTKILYLHTGGLGPN